MTNEEFLRKFDAHEEFSEKEIEDMCWGFIGDCVSEDIIEQGDWTIDKRTVFKVNSRFFWRLLDGRCNRAAGRL